MWSLEKQGRGRRATVLSISNGNETYRPGDFVLCDEFVGVISSLNQGETENTHQVELLQLEYESEDDKHQLLATSRIKWFPVSVLGKKLEPKPHPTRAIDHRQRYKDKIVNIDKQCGEDVHEFANYIAAQFITSTKRNAWSASKRSKQSKPAIALESDGEKDYDFSDSSDFSIDMEDEETLPTRKRKQSSKNGITPAATSPKRNNTREVKSTVTDNGEADLALPSSSIDHSVSIPATKTSLNGDLDPTPDLTATEPASQSIEFVAPATKATTKSPRKPRGKPSPAKPSPSVTKGSKTSPDKSSPRKRASVKARDDNISIPHLASYADSSSDEDDSGSTPVIPVTPRKRQKLKSIPNSPVKMKILRTDTDKVLANLHPATTPESYPCRDGQFDQLFYALEGAIEAETGTCIYVSGTPGTGKTSTIKEVLSQLYLRVTDNELRPFTYLEINGMKLVHPNAAYEHLWEVMGNKSMAASNAMTALEASFTNDEDKDSRGVIVVLLDELDQLVTKGQQLMYNFFNWPSLPHSKLVVIAVANTMDLPERVLSNKISSRVGLTRIQFPGYTQEQLKSIIMQRLGSDISIIDPTAIDYVTRKVAGVGGDARRALDFTRKGIVHARAEARRSANNEDAKSGTLKFQVKISHIRDVIVESQTPPTVTFVKTLGVTAKVLLCAVLMRSRREDDIEIPLHDVLKQARQLVRANANANELTKWLYPAAMAGNSGRIALFQSAIMELVEAGILVQQAIAGEATPRIRLMIPGNQIRECLGHDTTVKGMI